MQWLVKRAAVALYPRTDVLPGVADCALDEQLRELRTEGPTILWMGVVAGAVLFTLSPIFTVGVPLPAFWLPRSWRDKHASRIASSRFYLFRQAILGLKFAASLAWGRDPEVRRSLGIAVYPADPERFRSS